MIHDVVTRAQSSGADFCAGFAEEKVIQQACPDVKPVEIILRDNQKKPSQKFS